MFSLLDIGGVGGQQSQRGDILIYERDLLNVHLRIKLVGMCVGWYVLFAGRNTRFAGLYIGCA